MASVPGSEALDKLAKDTESLLRDLRQENRSPVVVEFAGSPKAGKSTTIDILAHFFKRMGFKVWAPTEGASKRTPYNLKSDLVAFNTWTLNYAISELLVAYHNVEHHDLIILDRGPFDSLAWMGVLRERGDHILTAKEYDAHRAYALHPRWSKLMSRLYLFKCEPSVSLQREHESKLTSKHGTAMNDDMLAALLKQYEHLEEELTEYPLEVVETSAQTTPLSTSYALAVDLSRAFRELSH